MKSTFKREAIFTPVTLELIFETREEYIFFFMMMRSDVLVPDALVSSKIIDQKQYQKAQSIMQTIYNSMESIP